MVPKRDVFIVLPYLGLQSNFITKQLKSCIYKFYGCINLKIIFRNTHHINSLFPYKDRLNRSLKSKVMYKASCWDCDDFYICKRKRRLHDQRKTEHFKALSKNCQTNRQLTSSDKNEKKSSYAVSCYAVTSFPVTPLCVLLTKYLRETERLIFLVLIGSEVYSIVTYLLSENSDVGNSDC